MAREGQGYPFYQHHMMRMMMMIKTCNISYAKCDNAPCRPGDPHNISFLKPLMDNKSDRVVVSLTSKQGHYTFLYSHTKHNREGGRKEQTNKHGLGSAPSARRRKSMWHFCAALRAFAGYHGRVFCAKLPQKQQAMVSSVGCVLLLLLTALSSRLVSSAFLCQLTLSVFSWTFIHSSTSGLAITDKEILWPAPTQTEMDAIVSKKYTIS